MRSNESAHLSPIAGRISNLLRALIVRRFAVHVILMMSLDEYRAEPEGRRRILVFAHRFMRNRHNATIGTARAAPAGVPPGPRPTACGPDDHISNM